MHKSIFLHKFLKPNTALLFLALLFNITFSAPIKSITCKGNINTNYVIQISGLKVGMDDNNDNLLKAKQNILEGPLKSFISDVSFDKNINGSIVINVQEKFFVQDVVLHNISYQNTKILTSNNILLSKKGSRVSKKDIESDAAIIKTILSKKNILGSPVSEVLYKIENATDNQYIINFYFQHNNSSYIRNISFLGNNSYNTSELKDIIHIKESKDFILNPMFSNNSYDRDIINFDVKTLKAFYQNKGFLDVKILRPYVVLNENLHHFDVSFSIIEGQKHSIGKLEIKDNENLLPYKLKHSLQSLCCTKVKDKHDFTVIEEIKDFIITKLNNHGLKNLKVVLIESKDIGCKRNYIFNIKSAKNLIISRINILGNDSVKEDIIRGRILLQEGSSYSKYDIERSKISLSKTGLFENVQITKNNQENNRVILDVLVKEKKMISIVPSIETNESLSFNINCQDKNFLNKGINIRFIYSLIGVGYDDLFNRKGKEGVTGLQEEKHNLYSFGKKVQYIQLSLSHPYLFGYESSVHPWIKIQWKQVKELLNENAYKEIGLKTDHAEKLVKNLFFEVPSIKIGKTIDYTDELSFCVKYGVKARLLRESGSSLLNTYKAQILDQTKMLDIHCNNLIQKISLDTTYNNVNDPLHPRNGIYCKNKISLCHISNPSAHLKIKQDIFFYHSFFNNFVTFASSLRCGVIATIDPAYQLSGISKFHTSFPGFDLEGIEPCYNTVDSSKTYLTVKGYDTTTNSSTKQITCYYPTTNSSIKQIPLGSNIFWQWQNEIRVNTGPNLIGLSPYIFCTLGEMFDYCANEEEKEKAFKAIQDKQDTILNFQHNIRCSVGVGARAIIMGSVLRVQYVPSWGIFANKQMLDRVLPGTHISMESNF